jgi:hypothetical protein
MLPVYKAISFQGVLEKGGRTRPWLILVNTGEAVRPYVVKLFDTALIDDKDSVTNEVVGNILAKEFELPVPAAALIELDTDFKSTIRNHELQELLESKDDRLKFGSELLEGFARFDPASISAAEARKMIGVDCVFAFDNLIRNPDRNNIKPNLLVKSDQAFLIDHELGFEITAETAKELSDWQWKDRYFRYHIFYEYLKRGTPSQKKAYFEEFEEYLRLLNIKLLNPYFEQLADAGFSQNKHGVVINYLAEMKRKSANFVNLLKGLIS